MHILKLFETFPFVESFLVFLGIDLVALYPKSHKTFVKIKNQLLSNATQILVEILSCVLGYDLVALYRK